MRVAGKREGRARGSDGTSLMCGAAAALRVSMLAAPEARTTGDRLPTLVGRRGGNSACRVFTCTMLRVHVHDAACVITDTIDPTAAVGVMCVFLLQ